MAYDALRAGALRLAAAGAFAVDGAFAFRLVRPEHVADAANGGVERVRRFDLLADKLANHRRELNDARRAEIVEAFEDYQAGRLGQIPAVHGAPTTIQESGPQVT